MGEQAKLYKTAHFFVVFTFEGIFNNQQKSHLCPWIPTDFDLWNTSPCLYYGFPALSIIVWEA